uniref:Uncharacterized protein n=1 Tax=Callorhinchus milii TaxID=7868 RepID=A0A4W3GNI5_CALMI
DAFSLYNYPCLSPQRPPQRPPSGPPAGPEDEPRGEEEEESESIRVSESDFSFQQYIQRFATAGLVKLYVLLLRNYRRNSAHTNHCAVTMLHRIGRQLGCPALLYQLSLFLLLRSVLTDPAATAFQVPLAPSASHSLPNSSLSSSVPPSLS